MPDDELSLRSRLITIAAVVLLFTALWLYVREFPVLNNTIGVRQMVIGAMLTGLGLGVALLFFLRNRITPLSRHVPDILFVLVPFILFAPLAASLLNRGFGHTGNQSFEFLNEKPFASTGGYGLLRTQQIKISGFALDVRENGRLLQFRYKKQAYFPLTKTGDQIMVPVCTGLFGFRVVRLE